MGPLQGIRIIEIAGIGPGPFCGMLLADMGADLIRIERLDAEDPGVSIPRPLNLMNRSRPSVPVDLKTSAGVDLVLRLCLGADGLFEGFRPGVMERLGLGPEPCLGANPALVYGRMTGWGQDGPLAHIAGHDTNFIARTGALAAIGPADSPPPLPLNLVGDFGGGALYLCVGMLAALLEASRSGQGQVVDAAIVDGTTSMMTLFHGLLAGGLWQTARHANLLDGGAPFARNYRTRDDRFVSVCAIENRFFRQLLDGLELSDVDPDRQYDQTYWPELGQRLAETFASRTRDDWCDRLEGTDACFAPVLDLQEARQCPHAVQRGMYQQVDGVDQPAPAPRFSRTPSAVQCPPDARGTRSRQALSNWGLSETEIDQLVDEGTIVAA